MGYKLIKSKVSARYMLKSSKLPALRLQKTCWKSAQPRKTVLL